MVHDAQHPLIRGVPEGFFELFDIVNVPQMVRVVLAHLRNTMSG